MVWEFRNVVCSLNCCKDGLRSLFIHWFSGLTFLHFVYVIVTCIYKYFKNYLLLRECTMVFSLGAATFPWRGFSLFSVWLPEEEGWVFLCSCTVLSFLLSKRAVLQSEVQNDRETLLSVLPPYILARIPDLWDNVAVKFLSCRGW